MHTVLLMQAYASIYNQIGNKNSSINKLQVFNLCKNIKLYIYIYIYIHIYNKLFSQLVLAVAILKA